MELDWGGRGRTGGAGRVWIQDITILSTAGLATYLVDTIAGST